MNLSDHFFTTGPFMPHGGCYLWTTSLIALHTVSDALIVLAYYSIPFTLIYFVRKRQDLKFHWMFVCFAVFILACGTTHLMEVWNIWHANYWVSGIIKAVTALASVPTAILLAKLVPHALALPSASMLQQAHDQLERRVAERTQQLATANEALTREANDRKQAEEKMKYLASFPEQNPNPIVVVDLAAETVFYQNPFATARFPDLQHLGLNHPYLAGVRELPAVMAGQKTNVLRREISVGDDCYTQTAIYMPEHRRLRIYGTDVTDLKRTEERLKASLREVRDLNAALDEHAIVAVTDPQGKITYVNDKFCSISKYSREELLGQDHRLINSGFHPKEFIRDLWTTIGSGRVWHGEIRNRAKDGSFYWVDTTIVPFLNEQGKPRQYVAIRADITERKQAEEAQMRLAAIVNSSDDAIIGKTLAGIITSWNPGAAKVFGYTAEEAVGHSVLMLIPPELQAEEPEILGRLMHGERVEHFETIRLRKDGARIDVSVTISPIKDNAGKVIGASKIARDITERKRAEAEILQLNAELEQRVARRTAELEAANRELEAFSYSISHDLRAPLRAVSGFAGIVIEDYSSLLPEQGRHYLDRVRQGGQRMGELIDDLLAFSRLSRQSVQRERIDSVKMVQSVWEELAPARNGRFVELRLGKLPACQADPALSKQVWINLLSNAIKYSRDRQPAIVEVGVVRSNGERAFFVRDNGVGFDMQYAGKLFGVFQRLHRADEFEGTGVGLAIVQRVVHRHGGRVWAEAKPDEGATFYFTLEEETYAGNI